MIVELNVENVAIIERASLSLGPGFTALTGETGAGKSLFVDAIELVFGARADTELVRHGANRAVVSVTLDLSDRPELEEACREFGAAAEDHLLYLQREVFAEGRSQARIGGKLAPLSTLRAVGSLLVDLHGQHDHQALMHPERHLGLLDAWIGVPVAAFLKEVAERLALARKWEQRLASLRQGHRERAFRIDLLQHQIGEIEAVSPVEGEMETLESLSGRLRHAERLATDMAAVATALGDGEANALDLVAEAMRRVEECARLDPELGAPFQALQDVYYALQDVGMELKRYGDAIEADPERLEQVSSRIDDLKRLRKKYGEDESVVLAFLAAAKEELETLTGGELDETQVEEEAERARTALEEVCARLSALRQDASRDFAERVEAQLRDLDMPRARFGVRQAPKEPDETGADEVSFEFSANEGEPMRPLSRIASGGEISRTMLAIKTVLAGKGGAPTLIFDEVDVGLGGRAAAIVAKKLEELAQHDQVIVISHLPQIASRAVTHFHIEKGFEDGRVTTRIRSLSDEDRVDEIARMLAGEAISDAARANARDMLNQAAN